MNDDKPQSPPPGRSLDGLSGVSGQRQPLRPQPQKRPAAKPAPVESAAAPAPAAKPKQPIQAPKPPSGPGRGRLWLRLLAGLAALLLLALAAVVYALYFR